MEETPSTSAFLRRVLHLQAAEEVATITERNLLQPKLRQAPPGATVTELKALHPDRPLDMAEEVVVATTMEAKSP